MLLEIRDFIRKERFVSTEQISRAFHIDEFALQPMLEIWTRRGVIRPCIEKEACQSTCFRCRMKAPVFYQYV